MAERAPRRTTAPAASADGDVAAMARLADDLLPALVARLEASSLGELEIRRGGWHIRLRRGEVPPAAPTASPAPRAVVA
ncbi:MAG: hypothetical protein ACHQZR_04510, partial [Candidatus Limnocylindrales bacterium]